MKVQTLTSRANPLLAAVRKLAAEPGAYRKLGQVWLEGDHLVAAATQRGWTLDALVVADAAWALDSRWPAWAAHARRVAIVPQNLFKACSALESPARGGALVALPSGPALLPGVPSVVLDRLQDPGNVGSILRSAAAFGVAQVLALQGTAALWSPKVLRSGMGAHFAVRLAEGLTVDDLAALRVPLLATSSHAGAVVLGQTQTALPQPCGWVFGHEGQGVDAALMARCTQTVRIPQPGGEESLNVAAAAAICLFATRLKI